MITTDGELRLGQPVQRLVIEAAWLVDPFTARQGQVDIEVSAGRISALAWRANGSAADGLLVAPALVDLSSTPDDRPAAAGRGGFARQVGEAEQVALGVQPAHPPLDGGAAGEGLPATILGLPAIGIDVESEHAARLVEDLRQKAHESGPADAPPLHLAHVSTAATLDLIRAAQAEGLPISCDVTISHICLHDGWLGGDRRFSWEAVDAPWAGGPADAAPFHPATRLKPPLRPPVEALALAAGLADGTIEVLSSGHRPHPAHQLESPYAELPAGISALETCLALTLAAVDAGVLPLLAALRALTTAPAAIAQLALPPLTVGAPAQLVVVDRRAEWGVDEESLLSVHNTPLLGRRLRGRVLATIVDGRPTWLAAELAQSGADVREESSVRR